MKRLLLFSCAGLFACLSFAMLGCSDDDDTGTNPPTTGNPSDQNFQYVQDNFASPDDFFDFSGDVTIAAALVNQTTGIDLSKSPARTGPIASMAAAEDTVLNIVITSWEFTADNWLVINFSCTFREIECEQAICDTSDVALTGIDSVQFLLGGVPLDTSEVGSGLDGLRQHAHVSIDGDEGPNVTFAADASRRILITVGVNGNDSLGQVDALVNEMVEFTAVEDSGTCTVELARTTVVDGIVLPFEDQSDGDCPRDGIASVTNTIDVTCTGSGDNDLRSLNIDGTWQVTAVVNTDGSVTVTYVANNVQWVVTIPAGQCG